jgi:hypothetical protein
MAQLSEATDFFSLPLEVRHMIYDYILPSDRTLVWDPDMRRDHRIRSADRDFHITCYSSHQVCKDLYDYAGQICGLRLVARPTQLLPEAEIPFDKLRFIEIFIECYDRTDDRSKSIIRLQQNIRALVAMMAKFSKLPDLKIHFRRDDEAVNHWIWRGALDSYLIRNSACKGVSVVEFLLDEFLELPVCRSVQIDNLYANCLPNSRLRFQTADRQEFSELCNALQRWLTGHRDVNVHGLCWSNGISRLGRLARCRELEATHAHPTISEPRYSPPGLGDALRKSMHVLV